MVHIYNSKSKEAEIVNAGGLLATSLAKAEPGGSVWDPVSRKRYGKK